MDAKKAGAFVVSSGITFVLGMLIGRSPAPEQIPLEAIRPVIEPPKTEMISEVIFQPTSIAPAAAVSPDGNIDQLFTEISSENFGRLARQAADSPDTMENEALLRVLISKWAGQDPVAALEFAQGMDRSDLLFEALNKMGAARGDEALIWLEKNIGDIGRRRYLALSVYQGMAKADAAGTVAKVEKMTAGPERDEILSVVMDQWARQDINAVFNWIETAELNPQLHNIYNYAMGHYIEKSPAQAAALVAEMQPCEMKAGFASQTGRKLAQEDVNGALTWALTLDEAAQKQALLSVIDTWASGPEGGDALAYIMANPEYPNYAELFSAAAVSLSYNDPDALLASMDSMSAQDQLVAAERLAIAFSATNPARCDQWLDTLESGPVRDSALKQTLGTYLYSNVSRAFELSQTLSDEAVREDYTQQVIESWITVDQAKAESALNSSAVLTEQQKRAILERVYSKVKPNDYLLP